MLYASKNKREQRHNSSISTRSHQIHNEIDLSINKDYAIGIDFVPDKNEVKVRNEYNKNHIAKLEMFLKRKQIALKDLLTKNGKNDFSLGNDFKKAINEAQKEKRQMTSIYCWNYIEGQFEISRFDYEQIHYGYHINQYDVLDFFRSLRDMPVYTGNEPSKPKPIKAWIIRNISVIYTRRNTWTFILVMTTVLSMVPVTILYWKIGFVIMYCILILFFGPFFFWCLTRIADKSLKKI